MLKVTDVPFSVYLECGDSSSTNMNTQTVYFQTQQRLFILPALVKALDDSIFLLS